MNYGRLLPELRQRYGRRCGYCGLPEMLGGGPEHFSVDQFLPRSIYPSKAEDPSNLVYACRACNMIKGSVYNPDLINPSQDRVQDHLRFDQSGEAVGITKKGTSSVKTLLLNRPHLIGMRRHVLEEVRILNEARSRGLSSREPESGTNIFRDLEQTVLELAGAWGIPLSVVNGRMPVSVIVREMSALLCAAVANDRREIDKLEWRDLERVVAEALSGIGFMVTLTRPSKDGGKDVVANCIVSSQEMTFYVEIKHWRRGAQPGLKHITDFVEVNAKDKTKGGLFLSSSGYTDSVYSQLGCISRDHVFLGEREKIFSLCQYYVRKERGLWVPEPALPEILFEDTLA